MDYDLHTQRQAIDGIYTNTGPISIRWLMIDCMYIWFNIFRTTSSPDGTPKTRSEHQRRPGRRLRQLQVRTDEDLIPLIDHANVACGGHAGDPLIMAETVRLCKEHKHQSRRPPGLPDVKGSAAGPWSCSPTSSRPWCGNQIGALRGFLDHEGVPLHHSSRTALCMG